MDYWVQMRGWMSLAQEAASYRQADIQYAYDVVRSGREWLSRS